MKIKIDVTQEDIDKGEQESYSRCPIARACERLGYTEPCVDGANISMRNSDDMFLVAQQVPDEVGLFVEDFDNGIPVEPFSFEIDADEII